ncbi:hypothetical protein B0H17DRAFT_1143663 [Mycena rosella]|uniref:Uncharacterized protein n=1 Tax=Mycena rosella TaxID=1033263 RepID=A0AAD7G7K8_MYCRO|nr:hypothetical protein B0H17DRAFT_1143663 [Mycena rosella]
MPATSIYSLPHPGPPPTCPLPPLPTKVKAVKRAHPPVPTKKVSPPAPKLPEGYAFVPPPVPLTYPASYHLIPAGPQNAPKRKRAVFQTITNITNKVRRAKRQELKMTVLRDAVGFRRAMDLDDDVSDGGEGSMVARFGSHFDRILSQHDDTDGGESGKLNARSRSTYEWVIRMDATIGFWGIILGLRG